MVDALADLQVDLAGDGRCDSPGYSTKYLTYSVLAMQNGCILHTEQVQVGESPEVPNSVSMEKRGLAKCLTAVENLGLKKKLLAASRKHRVLSPWIRSIINHLYWVAAMGQGDGDLVVSMWRSLLNQVCDKHDGHDGPYEKCLHEQLEDREWMNSRYVEELRTHAMELCEHSSYKESFRSNEAAEPCHMSLRL
ncbi:hypothetical protein MTO96_011490 [Rhipicephalus appendiculatus]